MEVRGMIGTPCTLRFQACCSSYGIWSWKSARQHEVRRIWFDQECFSAPWRYEDGKHEGKHVFVDRRRTEISRVFISSRLGGRILTTKLSASNSIAGQDGGERHLGEFSFFSVFFLNGTLVEMFTDGTVGYITDRSQALLGSGNMRATTFSWDWVLSFWLSVGYVTREFRVF